MEEFLPKHLYVNDFTPEHYHTLLTKLSLSESEELFNDKKGAIKKALIEFFAQSHQIVDLDIAFRKFSLKKHPFDSERSESFDRALHQCNALILDIMFRKEEYRLLPFLISVPEELRSKIFDIFLPLNETNDEIRKISRKQFITIFSLDERDIILFLKGRVSIRYFTLPKKLPDGIDKRFGGESIEDMEVLYRTYFPQGAWEHIEPILGEVIADKLDFGSIDNVTFSKNFIPVFRAMIEILLFDILSEDERPKIEGFTGYVLRQNFHPILLYTAKNLLEFVEKREKNAEKFIKYFVDEVIIDPNGNKIKKYAIVDNKNQAWNYSSILSVVTQIKQAKARIAGQEAAIATAVTKVTECETELHEEKNNQRRLMDEIASLESMMAEHDTNILDLKGRKSSNTEEDNFIKSEISRLNRLQNDLHGEKKNKTDQLELFQPRISSKISELTRRQIKLTHEQANMKGILEQAEPIFGMAETIAEALSLVLSKR